MASIVGAVGVPHVPFLPAQVVREGDDSETGRLFAKTRDALAGLRPDILVVFSTDHLNTFFYDNLPIFALGVADRFGGPNDEPEGVAQASVPSDRDLGMHLRRAGIEAGFDLALVQEFTVDHSIFVPLHFLTPAMDTPVVPVFVNGHVGPLPSAHRCFALGQSLGRAVTLWPAGQRVAFVASGSFSLEVLGPRMAPGLPFGVPDPGWAAQIKRWMETGEVATLLAETTPSRLHGAGNVAGELFNWLAMLGALDGQRAEWIEPQPQYGHAYGFWHGSAE